METLCDVYTKYEQSRYKGVAELSLKQKTWVCKLHPLSSNRNRLTHHSRRLSSFLFCHTINSIFLLFFFPGQINASQSLFTYSDVESPSTFVDLTYIPMFIDNITWVNDSFRYEAIKACGNNTQCLFDAAVTEDTSYGINTKKLEDNNNEINKELGKLCHWWPTGSASLQIEHVIAAELRTPSAKPDLVWMDSQFERKQLSQFGRNDALHLRTGRSGLLVPCNW